MMGISFSASPFFHFLMLSSKIIMFAIQSSIHIKRNMYVRPSFCNAQCVSKLKGYFMRSQVDEIRHETRCSSKVNTCLNSAKDSFNGNNSYFGQILHQ